MGKIRRGRDEVPTDGDLAHATGWGPDDCPWSHDEAPLERMLWLARWHRANYVCFWAHCHSREAPESVKNLVQTDG